MRTTRRNQIRADQVAAADAAVLACRAALTSPASAVVRLRSTAGVLDQVETLRQLRRSQVLELRSLGWSWAEISAAVGRSPSTVRTWCRSRTWKH